MTRVGTRLGTRLQTEAAEGDPALEGCQSAFVEALDSNWYTKYSVPLYTAEPILPRYRPPALRLIPGNAVKVRRIEANDWREWKASRLWALHDSPGAFASSFAAEEELSDDAWEEYARRCSASHAPPASPSLDSSAAFLARDEQGRVTGIAAAYLDDGKSTQAYICAMWVAPESRHRGVGRRLVDEARTWLVEAGATEVKAWVSVANSSALRFYEAVGFTPTGARQALASRPCIDEQLYSLRIVRRDVS